MTDLTKLSDEELVQAYKNASYEWIELNRDEPHDSIEAELLRRLSLPRAEWLPWDETKAIDTQCKEAPDAQEPEAILLALTRNGRVHQIYHNGYRWCSAGHTSWDKGENYFTHYMLIPEVPE